MRTVPPVAVTLRKVRAWCAALTLLSSLALAGVISWSLARGDLPFGARVAAVLVTMGYTGWLCRREWRTAPVRLQWTNSRLWVYGAAQPGWERVEGRVHLAMDLGPWMLLRFVPRSKASGSGARWLPVQRSDFTFQQWHLLRCALIASASPPDMVVNP